MIRVYGWVLIASILSSCYSANKAIKQVDKALAKYPFIVAKIAQDSFPCNTIRIDTLISVYDTTVLVDCPDLPNYDLSRIDTFLLTKKVLVRLPVKTVFVTKIVESTARLVLINVQLDSAHNLIRELQKDEKQLTIEAKRKNKLIWWLIAFVVGMSIPYLIKFFKR